MKVGLGFKAVIKCEAPPSYTIRTRPIVAHWEANMAHIPSTIKTLLPYLTTEQQAQTLAYCQARAAAEVAAATARCAVQQRRDVENHLYQASARLTDNQHLQRGQLVLNLRNRGFYEVVKEEVQQNEMLQQECQFVRLSATTGRMLSPRTSYCWGPHMLLPETHPFVKKRRKAELAERLEGKGLD